MRLVVKPDGRLPFVYFCAAMEGGLLSEDKSDVGVTRLMADLLVRGTGRRSAEKIAGVIDGHGGQLSPFSGYKTFGLRGLCLGPDRDLFLGLLAECLLNPAFPDTEIARQKDLQVAAIHEKREKPFAVAEEALRSALFPNHPYRWDPLGTEDSVRRVTRDMLEAHRRRHVVSSNLVLAVFGDITQQEALRLAGRHFGDLPRGLPPRFADARPPVRAPCRVVQRQPREQAIVLFGFPGVAVNDPRCDAVAALQTTLSGLSSDLALAVREKRGLAYYTGAYQQVGLQPGMFVVYAGTREDAVPEVEQLMREELARIRRDGPRPEVMERARSQMIGDFEMGLQDDLGVAMTCALNELYGLGFDYMFSTRRRIEALTRGGVSAAAESILATNQLAVSIVLPEQAVKRAAAPAGGGM
jgi:zinc protease